MSKFWIAAVAVPALSLAQCGVGYADPLAEIYVDDAMPLMYHSCKSVVEEAAGDEGYIDKVVRALVGMSLYNRKIDMAMFESNDEAVTAMHDKFVAALKKGCEEDTDALLAGVIDNAVAEALPAAASK